MNDLTTRKASQQDKHFAYHVKKAAFKEYVEKLWGWREDEQLHLHEQRFTTQDLRIISLAGKDIGVMALASLPDCLHLNQLFLLPEHQGKGIGAECMSRIIAEARQSGLPISLRVLKVNPRALAFYQRLGFIRTGETDTHVSMHLDLE